MTWIKTVPVSETRMFAKPPKASVTFTRLNTSPRFIQHPTVNIRDRRPHSLIPDALFHAFATSAH